MPDEKYMTWENLKENSDKLTDAITKILDKKPPKDIHDVIIVVGQVDKDCLVLPNPNSEGQYCQLILYPSNKWQTWSQTTMSITKYNLYT